MLNATRTQTPSSLYVVVLLCIFQFAFADQGFAQQSLTMEFDAELSEVFTDDGLGDLTGGTPGTTTFSGEIDYFDSCGTGCTADLSNPNDVTYSFSSGTGSYNGLGVTLSAASTRIGIVNDGVVDQDIVDFTASLGLSLSVGQTFDVWAVRASSSSAGSTPNVDWSIVYFYASANPFLDTTFEPVPPLGADLVLFEVEEVVSGPSYSAIGVAMAILQGTDCQPGTVLSGGSCLACSPGFFSATLNATACDPCAAGTASAVSGASSCTACAGGTFAASQGSTSCFDCAAGTFSGPGSSSCAFCDEGSASGQAAASCTTCDPGTIAPGTGNASCSPCQPGTSSVAASGTCFTCDPGTFNASNGGTCDACPSGTVAPSAGSTSCFDCSPGFESNGTQTSCAACQPGSFNDVSAGSCQPCATGTIAPTSGSVSCTACPAGTSNDVSQVTCSDCDAGSSNPIEGGLCELCPPGTITASSGAAECIACPADFFAAGSGSTLCLPCAAGETSPPGSASCQTPPPVPLLGSTGQWLLALCMIVTAGAFQGLWLVRERR